MVDDEISASLSGSPPQPVLQLNERQTEPTTTRALPVSQQRSSSSERTSGMRQERTSPSEQEASFRARALQDLSRNLVNTIFPHFLGLSYSQNTCTSEAHNPYKLRVRQQRTANIKHPHKSPSFYIIIIIYTLSRRGLYTSLLLQQE